MPQFNRPKSIVSGVFDPSQWALGKGDVKTRPGIHQIMVQQPLESDGPAPFTVFYVADNRMYRVDGVVPKGFPFDAEIYHALEVHWWGYDPMDGLYNVDDDDDGIELPF